MRVLWPGEQTMARFRDGRARVKKPGRQAAGTGCLTRANVFSVVQDGYKTRVGHLPS